MTVEASSTDSLEQLRAQVSSLEADREMLVDAAKAVYTYLVEPNPANGDPAPWDVVDDEHPIRHAARKIVDTLVMLGVEA